MSGRYSEQEENQWDRLLKIKTMGRDDSNADQYRYPYEPTPYAVLETVNRAYFFNPFSVELLKCIKLCDPFSQQFHVYRKCGKKKIKKLYKKY